MSNPFNPLSWLQSAQDWFTRAERSSGFRPYLIFLILAAGVAFGILIILPDVPGSRLFAFILLGASFGAFILLFTIKAFLDPDFCRSETHLHRMKKLDLEYMGSESQPLPGDVVEKQLAIEAPRQLPAGLQDAEDAGGGER